MTDSSIIQIYAKILKDRAKVKVEESVSQKTGGRWWVIYISWREEVRQSAFKRSPSGCMDNPMRRIKKFAVELREDTDDIKFTRMM